MCLVRFEDLNTFKGCERYDKSTAWCIIVKKHYCAPTGITQVASTALFPLSGMVRLRPIQSDLVQRNQESVSITIWTLTGRGKVLPRRFTGGARTVTQLKLTAVCMNGFRAARRNTFLVHLSWCFFLPYTE